MMKTLMKYNTQMKMTLVSVPPLDEDDIIQTCSPHLKMKYIPSLLLPSLAHQEENMMSYNPFENFDDALFHDFGNEEKCQKDLDEVSLAEGLNETLLYLFSLLKK
jgi:hypothetical protein